ncbi:unnamed protein product [marine sediment metagenome]|uniref:Uncharacterized protein n=1 Tax=marine sediment metagenome TaxID=412755 RepID=X1FYV0_9ZZZZ
MIYKISPKYELNKLKNPTFDDYVDVYEDRVRGWLIDSARILNEHEHAGFSVLQVALGYFEAYVIFYRGEDSLYFIFNYSIIMLNVIILIF